jgi:hypothetical protein
MIPDRTPWQPSAAVLASTPRPCSILTSPAGLNHLCLDNDGQWLQLSPDGRHRRITGAEAVLLRPVDVDLIGRVSFIWSARHRVHPRSGPLVDEVLAGAKAAVVHYAELAGERRLPTT